MWARPVLLIAAPASGVAIAQSQNMAPDTLPATAAAQVAQSLEAARGHPACLARYAAEKRRRNS